MPIPGAPTTTATPAANPTGSPFFLRVNGVWLQVEGVEPTVSTDASRPRSTFTSLEGNRYEQRGSKVRRSWSVSIPWAAAPNIGSLVAAAESSAEVWFTSSAALNLLPSASCFGATLPAIDCGGVPLGRITVGATSTARVRAGVPLRLSAWSTAAAGTNVAQIAYPGGTVTLASAGSGQVSAAFSAATDGTATITTLAGPTSGLMLTEITPPTTWSPGESMPCLVVVDDPEDELRYLQAGIWRHDYSITLREVG